jgi:hypothetical protein
VLNRPPFIGLGLEHMLATPNLAKGGALDWRTDLVQIAMAPRSDGAFRVFLTFLTHRQNLSTWGSLIV